MLRLVIVCGSFVLAGTALAKCRYDADPLKNCGDAVSDWWDGNASHQSGSVDDVQHRTESLGETLKDCTDCAMDKVESGFDRATPSTSTDTSTATDTQN